MAGGIQAGRLNIEIVAEIARLQQDLDRAKRAVKAASGDIAKSAKYANDNIGGMGRSSRLAGHHVQNLSFQLQDIFIGLKGGQKPMTVFMQQGSQIAQIMTQAGIGVGGLAKEIGGMAGRFALAHPVLLAVTAAAGIFAGAMALVTNEINKTSDVTVTWQDVMLGAFDVISAGAKDQVTAAFDAMGLDIGEVWDWIVKATKTAINLIIGMSTVVPRMIAATYDKIGPAIGDAFYSGANLAIKALNMLAQMSAAPLNFIIDGLNSAFGTDIPRIVMGGIAQIANPYEGAMAQLGSAGAAALTDTFRRDYVGEVASALSEAAQARARSRKAAEDAGKELGGAMGKSAGKEAAKQLQMTFEEAFKDIAEYMKRIEALSGDNAKLDERIADLMREAEVIDLVGWARERELKIIESRTEIDKLREAQRIAEAAGESQLVTLYQERIDKLLQILDLEIGMGDRQQWADDLAEDIARSNDELRDMAQLLNRIGGAGGVLGSILAIVSGDFNGIASGPVGDILAQILNQDTGKKTAEGIAIRVGDELRDIFGPNGLFGQTLGQTLAGAGMGYAAANALGMKGTGSGVGSSLGGILGQAVGSKVFTFLGSAAGPVGAIVGGLLGGLVGGLFGGTKKGVVGIGGSGADLSVYGTKHSNSERVAQATAAADSIISTISDLARTLGGAVNAAKASVTIGMRNDSFVVDTAGQGRTEGAGVMNFGKDQAAAVKAAMMDLIKDGVITGVRDSTMRLLQQSGDFEAALEKAIAWESILKNAETSGNSFAAEMEALGVQLEAVAQLAREAGASTAELAQVQEFMIRQQQALIDQATATYRSTFYSDAENVAFAKQTIAATLGPLGFGDVNTVAKYRALVEATDAVANPELYGTLMDLADEFGVLKDAAEAAAQASQLAAAAKKAEAEATLNAAKDVLRQAYQSESAALRETIDAASRAAETLAEFRDSLWGTEGAVGDVSRLWSKFVSLGMRANSGDLTAAGQLPGAGKDYLDAKRLSATSMVEYQRAVAMVARYTTGAIGAALDQKTDAELQLAAMEEQVGKLIDIDNSVISVEQAIERLTALQRPASGGGETREEAKTRRERVASLLQQVRDRLMDIETNTAVGAVGANQTARRLRNLEFNGKLLVSTEEPS